MRWTSPRTFLSTLGAAFVQVPRDPSSLALTYEIHDARTSGATSAMFNRPARMSTTFSAVEASAPERSLLGSKRVPAEPRLVASVLAREARAKTVPVFIQEVPQSHPLASSGLKRTCPIPDRELTALEKSVEPSSIRTEATAYSTGLRTQVLRV